MKLPTYLFPRSSRQLCMVDVVSQEIRSRMMSGIRATNTQPELLIRKNLHAIGFRYLLHDSRLPGKPDLVFPKWRAVIFINGCFWHAHDCHLFKLPNTRTEFWREKLFGNVRRDKKNRHALQAAGWRVGTVWECSLKGSAKQPLNDVLVMLSEWLRSNHCAIEIEGAQ